MTRYKSPNSNFHHLFHLHMDAELLELGLFQLFRNLGKSMLSLALPFYLYTSLNYEIWQICTFYLVWQTLFAVVHPFVGWFIQHLGLKHSMAIMTITSSIFWLSIPIIMTGNFNQDLIHMVPFLAARAFGMVLFEISYDIFLTHHLNRERSGKIIAYLQIAILMAALLAPIVGAFLTTQYGISIASYAAVGFFLCGGIVLMFTPDEKIKVPYTPKKLAVDTIKNTPKALYTSQAAWVFQDAVLWIIWPLFLVLVVKNLLSMSILIGVSSLLSMIIAYSIGKKIDQKQKSTKSLLKKGALRGSLINLCRAASFFPLAVLSIDFFYKVNWQSIGVPHDNEIYKWLHEKDTYERSHIRWWIIETAYIIPFFIFIPLFYIFPEGPQWLFITLFLMAGLSLLGVSQVTKLNSK